MNVKPGGVFQVFKVAFPLILVASSNSIKLFCDRTMLSHYSPVQMEASFTSGITYFTLLVFFIAVVSYCNVFVSQYFGAENNNKIGTSVWQGILASLLGWVLLGSGYWWGDALFKLIGRDTFIQDAQISYVKILFATCGFPLIMAALTAFWGGRGRTWMVLLIEVVTVVLNIILNYLLIFGKYGLPELGIVGAAYGTAISTAVGTAFAFILFLGKSNRELFGTWPDKFLDLDMFRRLFKFGIPNGMRAMLDVGAFNIFIIILSYYGAQVGQATTVTFSINALAFIPLFGLGSAISILVGQAIGAQNTCLARNVVHSGRLILALYLSFTVFILTVFEALPLSLFVIADADSYELTSRFMKFVAIALVFNGFSILYSSAISGAGDTKFPMHLTLALSWGAFALPLIVIYSCGLGVGWAWFVFVAHIIPKGVILYARYRGGKWQDMKVI